MPRGYMWTGEGDSSFKTCQQIHCCSFQEKELILLPLGVKRIYWLTCNEENMGKSDNMWLLRQGHKNFCSFPCSFSWIPCCGGGGQEGEGSCRVERTLKQPNGKIQVARNEASSQQPCVWIILELDSPALVKLLENASLGNCNLMGNPVPESPSSFYIPVPQKLI